MIKLFFYYCRSAEVSENLMLEQAIKARYHAYAPYSKFSVGCCLQSDDGEFFIGANVENAAYPSAQCAEASALGALITSGARKITQICVVGTGDVTCYPCGNCLQKLSEFTCADTIVHIAKNDSIELTLQFSELFPNIFKL